MNHDSFFLYMKWDVEIKHPLRSPVKSKADPRTRATETGEKTQIPPGFSRVVFEL
jgi:hypothetical protein